MTLFLCLFCVFSVSLFGQASTLRGLITDESAAVPKATVVLGGPSGIVKNTTSGNDGSYSFAGLTPGTYTVQASAPDLVLPKPATIVLRSGVQTLNLQLKIASTVQQVTVEDNGQPAVSTEATNNASAMVLRGTDL